MEAIECTHCRVLMTGWSAPGSTVRYWQCPFCGHTHSSAYGEVFRSGAGARVAAARPAPAAGAPRSLPAPAPAADPADLRWALLKARANRWFARLAAEERLAAPHPPARVEYRRPVAALPRRGI